MSASKTNPPQPNPHQSDQQFQVLGSEQQNPQLPQNLLTSTQAQQSIQSQSGSSSQNPPIQQKQEEQLSDQLLKFQKQQNFPILCKKCQQCQQLEQKLRKSEQANKTLQYNIIQITAELNQLKRVSQIRKEETVDKGQLNFCVDSLKQIIKSFEEENDKLVNFVTTTLHIHKKQQHTSTFKLVQSVISDFISNWHEIDRELNKLVVLSSPSGEAEVPKQDNFKYNFCEVSSKLDRVKDNVVQLQKRLNYQ